MKRKNRARTKRQMWEIKPLWPREPILPRFYASKEMAIKAVVDSLSPAPDVIEGRDRVEITYGYITGNLLYVIEKAERQFARP